MARLELSDVGYSYRDRRALDGLSLAVRPGEVVGLLGPNGSGKSTVVGVVSGTRRGYSGSVRLNDREIRDLPPHELARAMAVVPQENSFGLPFSALEVVLLGRHPHLEGLGFESARDVAIAREALTRCGAEDLAGRDILELSAGERQRVVFARALAQQPSCLVLDEPASFLDIRHQVELYDRVRELADGGISVLTVLHDLNLAAEYCDRLVLLRNGRVLADGPTAEVFTYARLRECFGTEVYVDLHDLTGKMIAIPMSGRVQRRLHPRE